MEIQRYNLEVGWPGNRYGIKMQERPEGDYVKFADHERAVAEYRDLLREWKAQHDGINLIGGCTCELGKRTDTLLGKG